jgi:hypothetical protein
MCWYCGGDQKINASTSTKGTITADTAENSYKMRFCVLKGKLCTNASINGFCTLTACNMLEDNLPYKTITTCSPDDIFDLIKKEDKEEK